MNEKIEALREKFKNLDLQGMIITNPVNIRYLTSSYIKNINGVGKFAFVSDHEHHLLSLLYILVTLFLVKAVFKALGVE